MSIAMVLLVVAGCTKPPTVPFTSPADGATEVAVDTTIQIGFSTAMDLVSTIDPANWSVASSIFGEISVVGALSEDARVLTLTPAASFAEGAVVTVVISDRVKTAVYVPIDEIQIHFTIEGAGADPGDFETGDDEFSIIQLLPAQGTRSVPVRPSVSASFDLPYQTSSVSGSVVVQGTRTGSRNPQFSFPGESGGLSDTLQMLIPGNTPELHPGEWLQIVYTADLASQIQPDEDEPRFLDPYVVRFRAHLGHATGGLGPQEPLIAGGTDALLFADLGDFLPYSGLEMLLIGNDGQLSLLRGGVTGEASSWTVQSQLQLASLPSAAVLVDFDGDSRTEAVIACIDGTLRTVGVVGQELVEEDDPMDLAGVVIDVLEWSELDGDGNPDLLAGSADGLRIIRQVTTFDLETLEFTTALSITGLMPFAAPVDSISVADLDRDGRLDAVVSAGEGVFLRGAGNGTFLVSGLLSPAPAGKISLGDVNGDGWIDAVATASSGLSIHLHPGVPIEGDWPGIPFVTGGLVQDLSVSEVDGDPAGIDDIVVLQTGSGDPLILFNRMSPDLADSVVDSLPYSRNPEGEESCWSIATGIVERMCWYVRRVQRPPVLWHCGVQRRWSIQENQNSVTSFQPRSSRALASQRSNYPWLRVLNRTSLASASPSNLTSRCYSWSESMRMSTLSPSDRSMSSSTSIRKTVLLLQSWPSTVTSPLAMICRSPVWCSSRNRGFSVRPVTS
ncbi:MAG: Ig-like domain-containing protein [Planctomycetes bacterium]|nr:Ig-like domain-containing protein [Planctomycetota bacterium]